MKREVNNSQQRVFVVKSGFGGLGWGRMNERVKRFCKRSI